MDHTVLKDHRIARRSQGPTKRYIGIQELTILIEIYDPQRPLPRVISAAMSSPNHWVPALLNECPDLARTIRSEIARARQSHARPGRQPADAWFFDRY